MKYFENVDQIIAKICELCGIWRDIEFFENKKGVCKNCILNAKIELYPDTNEINLEEYIDSKLVMKKLADEGDR